jgi:hypothetical protein
LHDAVTGEKAGVPSVGIMTEQFVSAATLMAQVLGADGHPFVVIPHPISSAADDALAAAARSAAADCVALLTGSR